MKKILSVIFIFLSVSQAGTAQDSASACQCRYRFNNYYDLAVSAKTGQLAGALSWSHLHGFGKGRQRFKIGYGLRFTSFVAANQFYTTAPSKYTSPVQGITTIFSETLAENIDTIALVTPQVNALNISVHLQYTFLKKLDLGFNIDAIGFSFGGNQRVNILSSSLDAGQAPVLNARPTKLNLLLTSDNDIGSLNSEFYLRYWIRPRLGIRAGFTFLFTEYTTEVKSSFDGGRISNDRYRLKSGMFMLAVSWRPFVKN